MRRSRVGTQEQGTEINADTLFTDGLGIGMGPGYERVTGRVFALDPWTEYEELEAFLKFDKPAHSLSYGELADLLGEADHFAWRAARLAAHAMISLEAFAVDAQIIEAAMREKAMTELTKRKEAGEFKKTIALDDITSFCAQHFAAEWKELQVRKSKAKRMVDSMGELADRLKKRRDSIDTLTKGSR